MRYKYNNRNFHRKKDKYPKDEGMTVTVRQVKNKDGTTTSDVNGAIRVLTSKGEKRRKAKAAGRRRYLKKVEKRKAELGYWTIMS